MLDTSTYNTEILNELFTSREYEFINNIDSDIENIDMLINKEEADKKIIESLITELNNVILTNNLQLDLEKACKLVFEAQSTQDLADENINILQINKQTYDEIKRSIIDLLVTTENDVTATARHSFTSDMINLRNNINTFHDSIQRENLQISLNRTKIEDFLNRPIVKEYLSFFNTGNVGKTSNSSSNNVTKIMANKKIHPHIKSKKKNNELLSADVKEDNSVLIVSEKDNKVYLPYSKREVLEYIEQYPKSYKSFGDVVKQEFIFPLDFYMKHPVIARFRESYYLVRDRESKSVLESLKFAIDMMSHYELNPAIIAACKSQEQLENYLNCSEQRKMEEFKDFEIQFDVSPMAN